MDMKKRTAIGWVVVWGIWAGGGLLWAAQPKGQEVDVEGTVAGVMPGMIQVKVLTGQTWMFQVSPKAKVAITGTAEKSFLQPGLLVEFKATLDQKFHATAKVTALTICSLSPQKFPGLFPEGGGLTIPEPSGPKSKKKEAAGPGNYHVVGLLLMGTKEGQYSVKTPQGMVVFELDDAAEIKVEMNSPPGLRYARAGDQIHVKGVAFREGMGEAREINVKLLTALTGPETSRGKKKIEKKTTEKPQEATPEEKPTKPTPGTKASKAPPKEE
jgi:hypothetical protein